MLKNGVHCRLPGCARSRRDRANPSFAALFPVCHDPFPLQAARPAEKAITPKSGGREQKANAPRLSGEMFLGEKGQKDREKIHEQL